MIRPSVILGIMGKILVIIGLAMATSVLCSLYYHEAIYNQLLMATVITLISGFILCFFFGDASELNYKEAFAIVALGWLTACFYGSLPFALSGYFASYTDALFETVSGFTTTGASILTDIEALPRGLLFWRSLTQWLGGMGIMVLFVALIQVIGIRASQIYKNEIAGGSVAGKVNSKARDTAKNLWIAYLALSAILLLVLWGEGMGLFDAFCHTFATMATGGFSTHNASIAYFTNPAIHWTLIVFMFLAGINFALYYLAFAKGDLLVFPRNREWRFYLLGVIIATVLVFAGLHDLPVGEYRIRTSLFQVISIFTTTGFATADYLQWSMLSQGILLILFFIGGSAGSTGGGIKAGRHLIMLERARIELRKIVHPRAVISQRLDQNTISDSLVMNVLLYFFLYMFIVFIGMLLLAAMGIDILTSFTAAASCMGNVGPGYGAVGPVLNYAFIPDAGKLMLAVLMLLGRLEIFPLLVLFYPLFWKK